MIDNINYDMGDNFMYEYDYIGLGSYCPPNINCTEMGSFYDLPAAVKVCPKGWRLPTPEEWEKLNEQHANCQWDNASATANQRDSLPNYEPTGRRYYRTSGITGTDYISFHSKQEEDSTTCYYWCAPKDNYTAKYYWVDKKYCRASISKKTFYISSRLWLNRLMFCRCVREVD
jgi:uncharacterized protein (TIGR02145 family)